ncbi:MAG: LTA synthase family protein, partial [Bacteroidales bacterium]|nr:LTA synthase family protein [Bacteroidales bacterium]
MKIITFCKSYIELCIWLLIFAVGMRFFEAVLLSMNHHDFGSSIVWNLTGLCYDITLFLRISVWILIVFIAFCFLSEKTTRIIIRILLSLILLISLMLIVFFATSGYLLDKVIFAYSLKEIWGIIRASSSSPVWVYIVVIGLPVLYFWLSGKRIKINRVLLVIFTVFTLLSFFIFSNLPLYTEQYHVKTNKEYFFWKSVFKKPTSAFTENDREIIKAVNEFRSYFPELIFEEVEFPFLYKAKYKDVLSSFFNLKAEPPNLVFIIIEGVGYEHVYDNYQLMPFLDSLSKESLSWEYCLSTSSRTFGVFPALFGALPLGEKGFMDQCPNNPEYHSLPRILHKNGYTNHFFHGGWMEFDNMSCFAETNDMEYFKNEDWEQDIKNEAIYSEDRWGYEDHLTYLQAHRKLNNISSPRMDVYLSLSTHEPFEYPNNSHFQDVLKNKTIQNKTLSEEEKADIFKYINIYGCYFYADWSIEQLIEGYKKREDFENTIFIITGDHIPFARQFGGYENYHVPLIIYSPMLKSGRSMKGVVTHRDITPTLLSLLKYNYDIETPSEVTWLTTALDTSLKFNANTFSPLQIIDHSVGGVVYKNYMLCEGIIEEFTDGIPRKINNPDIFQQMNRLQSLYQFLDQYILNNEVLIQNHYAHKFKNTIINIEDTITQESYFAEKSKLKVTEA